MNYTEEQLNVMKAFEEGKMIQYHYWGAKHWFDDKNPEWDWLNYEYRVHPNSATPLEIKLSNMYNTYILICDGNVVLKIADIECITRNLSGTDVVILTKGGNTIENIHDITFYHANGNTFRIYTYYEDDAERVIKACARVNAQLLIRWSSQLTSL